MTVELIGIELLVGNPLQIVCMIWYDMRYLIKPWLLQNLFFFPFDKCLSWKVQVDYQYKFFVT